MRNHQMGPRHYFNSETSDRIVRPLNLRYSIWFILPIARRNTLTSAFQVDAVVTTEL